MRRIRKLLALPLLCLGALALIAPAASAASSSSLPTVTGGFNQTPKITFPSGKAPTKLSSTYLHKGTGPKVISGDLLVANYLGQIWGGKVFDSSFSRGQLSAFPIGIGQVIPGWDDTLVGVPLGSEMLLVIPPADGYGPSGNTSAGIKGTSVLVFVVDVVAQYGSSAVASATATSVSKGVPGVTVSGATNKAPTVTVKKGTPDPSAVKTTLLAKGHGALITPGLVVMQLVQADWTGKVVASTWQIKTPYGANVGVTGQSSIFDSLVGMHLGSRLLIELPKISSGGPYALVVDAVAEPHDGA